MALVDRLCRQASHFRRARCRNSCCGRCTKRRASIQARCPTSNSMAPGQRPATRRWRCEIFC